MLLNPSSCAQDSVVPKTLKFQAEKGLLQRPSKVNGLLALKRPELPNDFQARGLKDTVRGESGEMPD